ncbi:MAG: hypothetical protein JWO69_80 [Thermoleophilia bacterium]|nr:hypothetical protein [Thermoleophilia bacterium]
MQIAPIVTPPPGLKPDTVDVRPLTPQAAGTLPLATPDSSGRAFVSAASGLAAAPGGAAWAVSDEYGELARFAPLGTAGALHPGLPRAENKPDLESITLLPATGDAPGALLAVGSGSKKSGRDGGVLQPVDGQGVPVGKAQVVDFGPLFSHLRKALPDGLNVEGVAVRDAAAGAELLLFHRGMATNDPNRVLVVDAVRALGAMRDGRAVPADALRSQHVVQLGAMGGQPLGFSDARVLPDGTILFAASAEGASAGKDGAILGSAIGTLAADFALQSVRPLTGAARKVEGIELSQLLDPAATATSVTLVTDPDDPKLATEVLRVDLSS